MLKEIRYKELLVSKLETMENNNECVEPITDKCRFVTKSFVEDNDIMAGNYIKQQYISFNPKKKQRGNDFDKIYNNLLWSLWIQQGKPTNVELTYGHTIILNNLDALSELFELSSKGFGNTVKNVGHSAPAITKAYPDNNIKGVFEEFKNSWVHYEYFETVEKYSKVKLAVDYDKCPENGIKELCAQHYSRFKNGGIDTNIKLVEELPEKVLAEAINCNILNSNYEPVYFTPENPDYSDIADICRLHGQKLSIY